MERCTIADNEATSGYGGGIFANGPSAILNNCTLSGNKCNGGSLGGGGGIEDECLLLKLSACTITLNQAIGDYSTGGGVRAAHSFSEVQVDNTIIAGNINAQNLAPDVFGSVISQGYNLIGIVDGSDGWNGLQDQTGDLSNPLDPKLGSLANNGGFTQTHALLSDSTAIGAGDPGLAGTLAQNDVIRSASVDIGAYQTKGTPRPISVQGVPLRPMQFGHVQINRAP